MSDRGYIHVYTGNGKGKTTAALGVAVRSLIIGRQVYLGQFMKNMKYSEISLPDYFPNFTLEQFGTDNMTFTLTEDDIEMAKKAMKRAEEILQSNQYDLVILDEVSLVFYHKILSPSDFIAILEKRNINQEVILTGRYMDPKIIDYADLVTEMVEVKHYYQQNVLSRPGIDR